MVEGGAMVDKKRLRPAQPPQKVALVKSNVDLLSNVTERKKRNKRFIGGGRERAPDCIL